MFKAVLDQDCCVNVFSDSLGKNQSACSSKDIEQAKTLSDHKRVPELLNLIKKHPNCGSLYILCSYAMVDKSESWQRATRLFYNGVALLKDTAEVNLLFDEARIIATKEELKDWRTQRSVENKQSFLLKFWKSRDPNVVDNINHRLMEHYRRLQFAKAQFSSFKGLDDRGVIYVKLGPPSFRYYDIDTESWTYEHITASLHFDFIGVYSEFKLGTLPLTAYKERAHIHPYYQRIAAKLDDIKYMDARLQKTRTQELKDNIQYENVKNEFTNTQREYYVFETGVPSVPVNLRHAYFREENDSVRIDISLMVPYAELNFISISETLRKSFLYMAT